MVTTFQLGMLVVIFLVTIVMVGVEQDRKSRMDRPTDTKGECNASRRRGRTKVPLHRLKKFDCCLSGVLVRTSSALLE